MDFMGTINAEQKDSEDLLMGYFLVEEGPGQKACLAGHHQLSFVVVAEFEQESGGSGTEEKTENKAKTTNLNFHLFHCESAET